MNAKTTTEQQQRKSLGIRYVSNALFHLWAKSADRLTADELEWFTGFIGEAETETQNLSDTVMGIGCLIDADNFSGAESASTLLFNIAHQLDTIQGMIHIGSQAAYRLNNPDLSALINKAKYSQ